MEEVSNNFAISGPFTHCLFSAIFFSQRGKYSFSQSRTMPLNEKNPVAEIIGHSVSGHSPVAAISSQKIKYLPLTLIRIYLALHSLTGILMVMDR